jgi:hypothetical protein
LLLLVGKLIGIALYAIAIAVSIFWLGAKGGKAPHSAIASAFVGHWAGTATQIGHGKPSIPRALLGRKMRIGGIVFDPDAGYNSVGPEIKTTFPVTMVVRPGELSDQIGTSTTPDCGGDLILRDASSAQISVEERLTKGFSACTDHDKITLRLHPDGTLEYNVKNDDLGLSASAILKRIGPGGSALLNSVRN